MRYGRLLLAGDAAHTVPPTGAKGLNLALADVRVLAQAIRAFLATRAEQALDDYSEQALARVWKAQHFSSWMTSMLHLPSGASAFDLRRQQAEIRSIIESRAGSTYLAEGYTGWPV
jgi:p-hydroxybenzoate 3-monooxygenase